MKHTDKRGSIRRKLTAMVLLVSVLSIILLGAAALSGVFRMRENTLTVSENLGDAAAENSRALLENEAIGQLEALAGSIAETVDARIQTIMGQVDILAGAAEDLYAHPDQFGTVPVYPADAALQGTYTAQIVYSDRTEPAAVADEVGLLGNLTAVMNRTSEYMAGAGTTQIGTESGFIIMCDENSHLKVGMGALEPTERAWYRMAADNGEAVWSEVFEDAYGRGLAVTCGKPVYGPDGAIRAVIAIGSQLSEISSTVNDAVIGVAGYAMVVDRNGDVIMSKHLTVDEKGNVTNRQNLLQSENAQLRLAAQAMIDGRSGVTTAKVDDTPVYLAFQPMQSMDWTVVTIVSVEEVLQPSVEGEIRINALTDTAIDQIGGVIRDTYLIFVAAILAAILLAAALGWFYSRRLSQPILRLGQGVQEISGGNLDAKLDITTGDEIEALAHSFNAMTDDLKAYIRDLTAVTAEKERIGAELSVATQIQASMLPSIFPPFPERKDFDIYASMHPAKEVGGDFYDFFLIDQTHLGLVMADVSGKGVPAALFMVIAKTLIKNHAQNGESPAQILTNVNAQLCESNDADMFVTAWVGVLDLTSGRLQFGNAGHNPPLLRQGEGAFAYLHSDPGFVLAGLPGMSYGQSELTLAHGDLLYLYTDGVTEAINQEQTLFGEERLLTLLNRLPQPSPTSLLQGVQQALEDFAAGMDQFDDITMLCLRRNPTGEEDSTL